MAFHIILDGVEREIDIVRRRPHLVVSIDGREYIVEVPGSDEAGLDELVIAGKPFSLARVETTDGVALRSGARTFTASLPTEGERDSGSRASDIRAPMPGAVISVSVEAGNAVCAGDAVMTIESMKLETVLTAPRDGIVAEVLAKEGDGFDKGQILARLEVEEVGEDQDA